MRFTLYPQVVLATILGAAFGWLDPAHAAACKPLGDLFIQLVKLTIGPIIFCTLVLGIAGHADRRKVGRLGLKALLYFEVVSTIALALGLLLGNLLHPGAGFHANPAAIDPAAVAGFAAQTKAVSPGATLLHIVPRTFFDAFTVGGDLLQVLFLTLLFGFGLSLAGEKGAPMRAFLESASQVFFKIIHLIMHLAPLGAFGAMAFTVGAYGLQALTPLLSLMGTFYLTCLLFVGLVLGAIA